MGFGEDAFLAHQRDVGVRQDALYTRTELGHHSGHTFTGLSERSRVDEGLRGDTAHIETSTSHLCALEDDDLQTLLGCVFSGAVTSRSSTDDNQISCCHYTFV